MCYYAGKMIMNKQEVVKVPSPSFFEESFQNDLLIQSSNVTKRQGKGRVLWEFLASLFFFCLLIPMIKTMRLVWWIPPHTHEPQIRVGGRNCNARRLHIQPQPLERRANDSLIFSPPGKALRWGGGGLHVSRKCSGM